MFKLLAAAALLSLPSCLRAQVIGVRGPQALSGPSAVVPSLSAAAAPGGLDRLFTGSLPAPELAATDQAGLLAAPKPSIRQEARDSLRKARARQAALRARAAD